MKRIITVLLAGLSMALVIPSSLRACDGNTANGTGRHHLIGRPGKQAGAGQGLNNGVNLSLDQSQQEHNQLRAKKWRAEHKKNRQGNS